MAVQERSVQQIVNLSGAPASPAKGWLYFDTGTNTLYWYNGTAWVAASGSASFGTPALTFSTSNAAGSSTNAMRVDATIAIFDTTAPSNSVPTDSAAVGTAAFAARRDHVHGRERVATHLKLMVE